MREKFKNALKKKSILWCSFFCYFHRIKHKLKDMIDAEEIIEKENLDEISYLFYTTDMLYPRLVDVYTEIHNLYRRHSAIWHYKFIDKLAIAAQISSEYINDTQTLLLTYLHIKENESIDEKELINSLDEEYKTMQHSITCKENILFRNAVLSLEIATQKSLYREIPKQCNFRELLEYYIPICNTEEFINVLQQSSTEETLLTDDERLYLAMSYISSKSYQEKEIIPISENLAISIGYSPRRIAPIAATDIRKDSSISSP